VAQPSLRKSLRKALTSESPTYPSFIIVNLVASHFLGPSKSLARLIIKVMMMKAASLMMTILPTNLSIRKMILGMRRSRLRYKDR